MDFYPIENNQPILSPSLSEEIWKKFEYIDKKAEDYPEYDQYDALRWSLLDLWFEQFQKEYKAQGPIFKKGGKNEDTDDDNLLLCNKESEE